MLQTTRPAALGLCAPGLFALSAVLGLILAVRLVALALSPTELAYDEAQYWAWSQDLAFGYYTKPGLIAWVLRAVTDVCGNGAVCVRLPAPLFHIATSAVLYAVGKRLYSRPVGFWSAVVYATLPGVSVSSMLITTDVPLLFFWTVALYGLARHVERPSLTSMAILGVGIGFGLNAKYAMIYFPALMLAWMALTPAARPLLGSAKTWGAVAIGLALILPNVWWNAANGFVTVHHTRDNAGRSTEFPNFEEFGQFLLAQFGTMGPLLFATLVFLAISGARTARPHADRMLIALSVPIVVAITVVAILSKAHGNWAAPAYPAAVVLVVAWIVERRRTGILAASLAIAAVAALGAAFGPMLAGPAIHGTVRQYERLFGWEEFAGKIAEAAADEGIDTVVAYGRPLASQLVYGLRDRPLTVKALAPGAFPADHFQMTRPWRPGDLGPVLLVTAVPPADLGLDPARVTRIGAVETRIYLARGSPFPLYRIDPGGDP